MSRSRVTASIYALLAISFWGVSFVSTKAALGRLDPYSLLALRFGIGALFLLLLLTLQRSRLRISVTHIPHLIVLGVLGVFIHQVLQTTALLTIEASSAGWLISFSPVFTVILSILFLQERMTLARAAGMTAAITGVLLVTAARSGDSFHPALNIGIFLMILSTLNWAVYSILLKSLSLPYTSLVVTFYMCLTGLTLTTPFLIRNRGWEALPHMTQSQWAHLLFLGIFVSGVGYWYWGKSLEVLEASRVSMFLYLEPAVTLAAAVLLLQERISILAAFGGILIIIGVIIVNGRILPSLAEIFRK
ncbi:DMT family transporter [Peribacillus sp. SCS-26]|uniref:DMT family transporter n=1 Tax=Paraperibacillus marinus TaxID=3115295 RepID=UPI0039064A1C